MKERKSYLVAVDLEGIHGILGDPYKTLTGSHDYKLACENAVKEANAVVDALFAKGAERVTVWDNHGGWNNMDVTRIDPRADIINGDTPKSRGRMFFVKANEYDGMICLGYHSKEGTVGGVLAHTYSSVAIQYYKLNGKTVGELEVDKYCAAELGLPIIMVASDLAGCEEAEEALGVPTVVTKIGSGRNTAELFPEDAVLGALRERTAEALDREHTVTRLPMPASFEVRYTRTEDAEARIASLAKAGIAARYGEDSHTVTYMLSDINDIFA